MICTWCYFVLQCVIWVVALLRKCQVCCCKVPGLSLHLECGVFFLSFCVCVSEKKELGALLLHARGYESTSTITRLGGLS